LSNTVVKEQENKRTKKQSQFKELWRRFKKNPQAMIGLVILIIMILTAISAEWIAPGTERDPGYDIQDLAVARQFPSLEYPFGTDHFGRCIFSRVVHGSRNTLTVGLIALAVSATFGIILGAVAGYYTGLVDNIIMRLFDVILAIPAILLAMALAAAIGRGINSLMIATGVAFIPFFARVVRGQVLSIREQEYIEAARSVGASDLRIIFKHVLPNSMAPIIIQASMGIATMILVISGLSFLGMGMFPPAPEWGMMLSDGRRFMLAGYWHMTVFPGVAIALVIIAFNLIGDGLRDAFDPKLRSAGFSMRRFKKIRRSIEKAEISAAEEVE